jgi:hypothetical protein
LFRQAKFHHIVGIALHWLTAIVDAGLNVTSPSGYVSLSIAVLKLFGVINTQGVLEIRRLAAWAWVSAGGEAGVVEQMSRFMEQHSDHGAVSWSGFAHDQPIATMRRGITLPPQLLITASRALMSSCVVSRCRAMPWGSTMTLPSS